MPDEPARDEDAAAAAGTNGGPEDLVTTEVEAPEALFELDIGDAEVDFFLEGVWRASVFGSIGVLIGPEGTQLSPFPGLDTGQVFQQMPDLTFSVWLLNRFFIEASVIGDFLEQDYEYFDQNYILMGYIGAEEEFLKRVLIGSRDIGIDPYPFIDVPASGLSSLGVEALLGTGMSEHQLLLRYDNNEPDSLTFIGRNLVSEQVIPLDEYIRGRFFKLPDDDIDAGTLEVYLQDRNGSYSDSDGRRYRKATVDDAELDRQNGTVFLKEAAAGNVVVYYEKGAAAVGDGSLGGGALAGENPAEYEIDLSQLPEDFEWDLPGLYLGEDLDERKVTVDGKLSLLLYRPGEFSPFEILAGYWLDGTVPEDLSRLRVSVVRKGSLNQRESTDVAFRLVPGKDYIQAYYEPDPDFRAEFRNLYPFLDAVDPDPPFDPDNLLYGPLADAKPGYLDYEILASELTPVSAFQIGADIVPGSVQILRNDITETRFEVDYDSGVITFLTEIGPEDRLVVSFRRKSALANNGDILFAWGNTLTFSEALNLRLATGVRWNFLPGSYTEEAYSRTGSVILSAGADGKIGPLTYQASLAGAYTNPDTTGVMRLLGMESTGIDVPLSENTAYPAAPPADDTPFTTAPLGLPEGNRGRLYYKDYRLYGFAGTSVLQDFSFSLPADQDFAYATGSKPGPYSVAEANPALETSQSLVLDFDLDPGDWIGIQLPMLLSQGISDLSDLEGVALSYMAMDDSGSFDVYLQLGEISEDLDPGESVNDVLDEELSANAAGFTFNDIANSASLRVGSGPKNQGNGRLDSEDIDGNGFLDTSEGDIVTFPLTAPTNSWQDFVGSFDASEKSLLKRVRSLRLIVVETSNSATASAKLLVDRISLIGSRFRVDRSSYSGTIEVREIEEWQSSNTPPRELQSQFATVEEIFHPFGETQKVVEISWSGGSGDSWEVKGYTEAQTEGIEYRNIVYYYRNPAADGSLLKFALTDPDGRGVHWQFAPIAGSSWAEIRVSLDERKVYRNGTEIPGAVVTADSEFQSLSEFSVMLENSDTGTLYLDELHLTDPAGSLGAGATLDLELNLPGELVTWGAHPVIHDLTFRQSAAYASRGFSTLYGTPLSAQSYSSASELDLGLSLLDVSVDFSVDGTITDTDHLVALGLGHGITVPNISFPVVLSESFSLRDRETGKELQRENTLRVTVPPLFKLDLEAQAGSLEGDLSQSWEARLGLTPAPFNLQNSLTLSGARDGFSLPVEGFEGYFGSWIYGYGLLAPWQGGNPVERKANLSLDWGLNTAPVGVQALWQHGFHSYDYLTAQRNLDSSAGMELELPILRVQDAVTVFTVTPGYRRSLDIADQESGIGDYATDFSGSFQQIYTQQYLYGQLPFAELYSSQAEQLFLDLSADLDEADYSAEAYVRLSRRFSSRIRDLFLPSFFELGLNKRFLKDKDLIDLFNTYTLTAQSTALNLFGDYGAFRLFPFYRTDEFSTSLSLSFDVDGKSVRTEENPPLRGLEMNLGHFLSFEGERDNALTFENRFYLRYDRDLEETLAVYGTRIRWDDTVKLLYTWYRYPETGVRVPLLPETIGEEGYWSHIENVELELNGPGEQSSWHPLNVIVSHQSSLVLPDYGEISAEIAAGFDAEQTEQGQRYWRFGVRGGISVQIEF